MSDPLSDVAVLKQMDVIVDREASDHQEIIGKLHCCGDKLIATDGVLLVMTPSIEIAKASEETERKLGSVVPKLEAVTISLDAKLLARICAVMIKWNDKKDAEYKTHSKACQVDIQITDKESAVLFVLRRDPEVRAVLMPMR